MTEKHDRADELRQLLRVTWETIGLVKPEAVSPLLNAANRFSRDLYELENSGSTASPAPVEDGDGATAVSIFQARMRKRDTRAS